MYIFAPPKLADMAKLVDVPDLGSGAARRVGSSPIIRTKNSNQQWLEFFYFGRALRKSFGRVFRYIFYSVALHKRMPL